MASGVTVLDDYAHHPTAVRETLRALRERFAKRRLVAVYEPRSATSRRSTFQAEFAEAFALADEVVVGKHVRPEQDPPDERFDPERLALDLHRAGTQASYLPEVARHGQAGRGTPPAPGRCRRRAVVGQLRWPARPPARRHRRCRHARAPRHMPEVRALLERCGLAGERASDDDFAPFFALSNERGIIGCVALEVLGEDAILRALAVDPEARGGGYGWMLADMAVAHARHRGARRIYLLTDSASDFFAAKLGFRVVDRSTTSAEVASSATFRASAGSTFVAMRLDL